MMLLYRERVCLIGINNFVCEGRTSIADDPRSRCPSDSKADHTRMDFLEEQRGFSADLSYRIKSPLTFGLICQKKNVEDQICLLIFTDPLVNGTDPLIFKGFVILRIRFWIF